MIGMSGETEHDAKVFMHFFSLPSPKTIVDWIVEPKRKNHKAFMLEEGAVLVIHFGCGFF